MPLPILGWAAVAAVSAVVAVVASSSDEDDATTENDREEREEEAREEAREEKSKIIKKDIKKYKKAQIKRFKDKYNADIEFVAIKPGSEQYISVVNDDSNAAFNAIKKTKKDTAEMTKLIIELEAMRDEALG